MNSYLKSILESSVITEEEFDLYNTDALYEGLEEEDMSFNPKSVPIKAIGENEYAITLGNLNSVIRYCAESDGDCTEYVALEKIAEANGIAVDSIAVVIPSQEEMNAFVEACVKEQKGCNTPAGKEKAKCKVKGVKGKIEALKEKGIKIKKSK